MHTCTSRHFSSAPVRRGQASRRPRRVAQRMAVDTVDKLISSSAIPAQVRARVCWRGVHCKSRCGGGSYRGERLTNRNMRAGGAPCVRLEALRSPQV